MNTARIRHAANEIDRLEKALSWLTEHGVKISKDGKEEMTYRPNFAGSCNGAKEAAEVLSAMASNRLPDLIQAALENCQNTIEIHRETLRNEATKE